MELEWCALTKFPASSVSHLKVPKRVPNKASQRDCQTAARFASPCWRRYAEEYDVALEDNNSRTANGSDDEKNR